MHITAIQSPRRRVIRLFSTSKGRLTKEAISIGFVKFSRIPNLRRYVLSTLILLVLLCTVGNNSPHPVENSRLGLSLLGRLRLHLFRGRLKSILNSRSAFHGNVSKAGLPLHIESLYDHQTNLTPDREGLPLQTLYSPAVWKWFGETYAQNATSPPSHSPIPSCHFYIDHNYTSIFVRLTKTAGTTITKSLGYKENPAVCTSWPQGCYADCQGDGPCFRYMNDIAELKKYWDSYFVFTVVRNPFTRAISSFNHINTFSHQPKCNETFKTFAQAPSKYAAKCLLEKDCCKKSYGWVLEHLELQSPCIIAHKDDHKKKYKLAVDYVAHLESIDQDFPDIIRQMNARRVEGAEYINPPLSNETLHLMTSFSGSGGKELVKLTDPYAEVYEKYPAAIDDIRKYYGDDFRTLGF